MTFTKNLSLSVLGCALLASHAAQAEETFINPEWASSAWYIGAGIGQSRATIDKDRLTRSLSANGAAVTAFTTDERELGYKLFMGKQLNKYFAVEAGLFDLGKFGFNAATSQGGVLRGDAGFKGVSLDLAGQLPLSQRISVLGRIGMNYAEASTHFSGNRLFAVTDAHSSERKLNAKAGVGLEYKIGEALALRGEMERYRVNDAVGNRGDADLYSLSLVYKLGRPVTAAKPAPVPVPSPVPGTEAATPAPVPAVVPAPVPAPATVAEKVSMDTPILFGFGKSVLGPIGRATLDDLLGKVQGLDLDVMVSVGHADAIGSHAANQRLSLRRAAAVKAYLVAKGVDGARVTIQGKGETAPVASNKTAAGRAKNRRVNVHVTATRTVTR